MPRRKRNRKTKNSNLTQNISGSKNTEGCTANIGDSFKNDYVPRSCVENVSLSHSQTTPFRLISPLTQTPESQLQQHFLQIEGIDSINTTPVNRNKSTHHDRKNSSRKLCITNLNVLFDSDFAKSTSLDGQNDENLSNSLFLDNSSCIKICETNRTSQVEFKLTPKHIPYSPRGAFIANSKTNPHPVKKAEYSTPVRANVLNNEHVFQSITETPRGGNFYSLEEVSNDAFVSSNHGYNLSNCNPQPLKPANTSVASFKDTRVNYNPYIQNNNLKNALQINAREQVQVQGPKDNRDASVGELSFFTPRLYDFKSASTPIEEAKQHIGKFLKDVPIEGSPKNVTRNVENLEKAGKLSTTLYLSCSPTSTAVKQTNLAREVYTRSLTTQTSEQSLSRQLLAKKRKTWKSLTPKLARYVNHSKLCARSHSFTCQRMHQAVSPRNISLNISDCRADVTDNSTCEKIFTRLKRYSRMSARWSMRVLEICAQLGITLKKSLTTMCQLYTIDKSLVSEVSTSVKGMCKCSEYRNEIDKLNVTIKTLSEELMTVKLIVNQQKENGENMLRLNEELQKIKDEMGNFMEMKRELDSLREKVNHMSAMPVKSSPVIAPPPPAPPAPPPPPPPLPPPMPLLPANTNANRQSRTLPRRRDKKATEEMRPIISLEDILKVKLKKTKATDRPSPLRRSTQPVVSMDMLRQVKLRPASRPQTPVSLTDGSSCCSSLATSPHSSLTRLLTDTSISRVKRLKRAGGYSFDDFYRRNQLAKRDRDRERTED